MAEGDPAVGPVMLPNRGRAVVDLTKLVDYCLDPGHPRGRHKARVFAAKLGIDRTAAAQLRAALLSAATTSLDVVPGVADGFGRRYIIDFLATGPKGTALVRSAWIIRVDEDFPRFTSCYVL
jgi:hypothetical protein